MRKITIATIVILIGGAVLGLMAGKKQSAQPAPWAENAGLPGSIALLPELQAFLKSGTPAGADEFRFVATSTIFWEASDIARGGEEHWSFDGAGNPKFPSQPEPENYSQSRARVLLLEYSEPDSFIDLWDLKEKSRYRIGQCGTPCRYAGFVWAGEDEFVMWGDEFSGNDYGSSAKFLEIVNIANSAKTRMRGAFSPVK